MEAEADPYRPPAVDPTHPDGLPNRVLFPELSTPELKTLRNDSHSIRTYGVLLLLAILILVLMVIVAAPSLFSDRVVLLFGGVVLLNGVAAVGLFVRHRWGRLLGFVHAGLGLILFPVGTLIGALVIFALARGKRLFGSGRFLHGNLEKEWRYRRKHKIS